MELYPFGDSLNMYEQINYLARLFICAGCNKNANIIT